MRKRTICIAGEIDKLKTILEKEFNNIKLNAEKKVLTFKLPDNIDDDDFAFNAYHIVKFLEDNGAVRVYLR